MLHQQAREARFSGMQIPPTLCFATIFTNGQEPVFEDFEQGRAVVSEIRRQHEAGQVDSFAFVVMPNQLLWLFALGSAESTESAIDTLKQETARVINNGTAKDLWEAGFLKHESDQGQDLIDIARFIINNPVREGLARDIGDYALWDSAWSDAYSNL